MCVCAVAHCECVCVCAVAHCECVCVCVCVCCGSLCVCVCAVAHCVCVCVSDPVQRADGRAPPAAGASEADERSAAADDQLVSAQSDRAAGRVHSR